MFYFTSVHIRVMLDQNKIYLTKIKLWQEYIHTLQASPSGTLLPTFAITGYATEGALLIFLSLPTEITPTSVMPLVCSVNL